MANIIPFKGLRYNQRIIRDLSLVTTYPYDVISLEAQERCYSVSKYNIIRAELGRDASDNSGKDKYSRAADFLTSMIADSVMIFDDKPSLYIYDQEFALKNGEIRTRRGIICLVQLAEFSERIVLPHEETLSAPKIDRLNLIRATRSNISPIFSLYDDPEGRITGKIDDLALSSDPCAEFKDAEGVTHRLWVIDDERIIIQIQSDFLGKQLFIADGHHRYEAALGYRREKICENPFHTGNESYNYVMMCLFEIEDPGLMVFPTHRVIRNVQDFSPARFLQSIAEHFEVSKIYPETKGNTSRQVEEILRNVGRDSTAFVYFDGVTSGYQLLKLKDYSAMKPELPERHESYRALDVAALHTLILEKRLGINAETMASQKNLTYTRDVDKAVDVVLSGSHQCAFFLNPTKVQQIKKVCLADEKMPQKSTYFYPKLITGLVMYRFQE